MWTTEIFGTDIYHLIAAFVVYSMLGWLVESIYMSFCNRTVSYTHLTLPTTSRV